MVEIHVGEGFEHRTLAAAMGAARVGDRIVVHEGVYKEALRPTAGVTVEAAPGERAAIDGGWNGKEMTSAEARTMQVAIGQPGVTLRGLEIRNVPGWGVKVAGGGDNFTMENCHIHHTVQGGFGANGTGTIIRNLTIRDCDLDHLSMSGKWQETPVNGCCLFRYVAGLRVNDTHIRFGYGEGFALGPFTQDAVVDGLWVEDTVHLGIYVSNRARQVLFENCVIIQRGLAEWRQGDGDVGAAFVFGDEVNGTKTEKWPHGDEVTVRRCAAINAGSVFGVRNNKKVVNGKLDGYDTQGRFTVENCTFVAGPDTRSGINVAENEFGGTVRGAFRNNLFVLDRLPAGAVALRNTAPGVIFEDNLWSGGVPAALPGSNRPVAAAALVDPFAAVGETANLNNYRPVAGGPLDGAGVGALEALPDEPEPPPPPPPPPDPDPEPTPVDWAALRALAAEAGAEIVTAYMATDRAARAVQTLDNRMREYELAAASGEEGDR